MKKTISQILIALLVFVACPAANADVSSSPVDTIHTFYRRYLDTPDRYSGRGDVPALVYSKKFRAALNEHRRVCCKDEDGPCGWGDDTNEYLDSQEIDPLLRYANSRFEIKALDARTVQVRFNVYPSEKDEKGFYDKLITYRMINEGGQWLVDDLSYRDGVSVRAQLAKEMAKARADAARPQASTKATNATNVPFATQFEKIVPLCEELFLPNSMAQDPDFDIDANQRDLEKQIEAASRPLRSRDGLAYLKKRLASEQDDVAQACIRRIVELPAAPAAAPKR